ncbi:hypothetical protein AHAS_Ahas02G0179600 [Arachis hypogaea]
MQKQCFTNKHMAELDITSHEEIKFIELHITEFFLKKSAQTINKGDGNRCLFLFTFATYLTILTYLFFSKLLSNYLGIVGFV